jgi:Arc/MetJ-type ribon-helix-helix transcriptional regulator
MPKKGSTGKGKKNNQISVTLPAGARHQLDQLVKLKTEGDSHSEVIRAMVIAQLRIMRREYGLRLMSLDESDTDSSSS